MRFVITTYYVFGIIMGMEIVEVFYMNSFQPTTVIFLTQVTSPFLYALCLYFVLSFFQALKSGEDERVKKMKIGAVLTLVLAMTSPFLLGMLLMR